MTESVKSAQQNAPAESNHMNIMERLEAFKDENPNAKYYFVSTEIEAAEILIAMAAALKLASQDLNDDDSIETMKEYARIYRAKTFQGKALEYLMTLSKADKLSIFGMELAVKRTLN